MKARGIPYGVAALTLAILGAAIALTTRQVRAGIREQMVRRDGAVLHAVALAQLEEMAGAEAGEGPDLLTAVLLTSRLKGVLAARLMNPDGRFVESFPVNVREADVGASDLAVLRRWEPVCRFHPRFEPDRLFYPAPGDERRAQPVLPLLEVNVPLHRARGPLLGVGQFLIEGHSMAAEFAELDWRLAFQVSLTFVAAATVMLGVLSWAFRRLRHANQQLAERTAGLLRANQELALSARTAAVGALASHLIHGLKSPLTGLQEFVSAAGRGEAQSEHPGWEQAAASTRRMQALINEVVNVLREEEACLRYEVSLSELLGIVRERVQPTLAAKAVRLEVACTGDVTLDNRTASLVAFVLVNLIDNAVAASPAGERVEVEAAADGAGAVLRVRDRGRGFPEARRRDPFAPGSSTVAGGSGLGLAISRQLAAQMGAVLELQETSAQGSTLELRFAALAKPGGAER